MIEVSSPARADFLNTHQDYKGLPVVPAALNIRLKIKGEVTYGNKVYVRSLNFLREGLPYEDEFSIKDVFYREKGWFGNYVRAVVNILRKKGYEDRISGMHIEIDSEIPMGGGLGSSGSLEVALVKFFDAAFNLGLSTREVAEFSYLAEREELGIPCGRLDQYGAAFGGIIKLETRPPFDVEILSKRDFLFVIVDSGIKHSTAEIHPKRQREIDEGLKQLLEQKLPEKLREKLSSHHYEVEWEKISEEEIFPFLSALNEKFADRILFTIRMHKSTKLAIKILRNQPISVKEVANVTQISFEDIGRKMEKNRKDLALLGLIVNYQHLLLRDLYEVSLPEIEEIRYGMLEAGAYGVKISGAGLGGSIIGIVDKIDIGEKVLEAGLERGGVRGWVSTIGECVKVEG
ncbi:MAG: GHMP family kinase ATP-binding protein [Candidatus Baldrarchaeia archaeon]